MAVLSQDASMHAKHQAIPTELALRIVDPRRLKPIFADLGICGIDVCDWKFVNVY